MQSENFMASFALDPKDMDLIISGLAEVSKDDAFPVDQTIRARDLQGTFHTITRLWSEWRITASDPIGGE
ncbi:Protein of unknown function [Propionibacterium freudenreichii]|nr:Protein of unknown function [Propionibacterium freudenreichii]